MAASATTSKPEPPTVHELCCGIRDGSSYMAFLLACRLKPHSVHDLLDPVGKLTEEAFDAGVDGYRVWQDAQRRGLLR